jgi:hypothetical protein
MDAAQKNMAVARGDALAAGLIAEAALRAVLQLVPDRDALFNDMFALVDDVLNLSGRTKGDASDEVRTFMCEHARAQAMHRLEAIKRGFDHPEAGK